MADAQTIEPQAETGAPESTLAEHEAQFTPQGREVRPAVEEKAPSPKERHRAKSQIASADDVETIKEYTKRLREAEDAITIERKADESDRAYQLRKRAEIAEGRRDALNTPAPAPVAMPRMPEPQVPVVVPAVVPAAESKEFVKPNFEAFKWGSADPEYIEALTEWNVKTALKAEATRRADEDRKTSEATRAQHVAAAFRAEVAEAVKRHPDFEARALKAPTRIPPGSIMDTWIMHRPKLGAEVLYYLQDPTHEPERARIHELDALAQIEELTLLGQRLTLPSQAVTTGAAAMVRQNLAPPPPTPVRAGPTRAEDDVPDDTASVAEHEKFYGPHRRRR